jgi:predicted transposase/invertase (TIGR01784 family)
LILNNWVNVFLLFHIFQFKIMTKNTDNNQTDDLTDLEKQLGTYIDPLTDFGFKRLFGQEDSKKFLISFLNSLLERFNVDEISDLEYKNSEILGNEEIDRKVVFDLYCTTKSGHNFVVELQKGYQSYYQNRSLAYGCMAIADQLEKGKAFKYNYNKVFVVSILNFHMREAKNINSDVYIHSMSIRNDEAPHDVFSDKLQMVFIELPKFKKTIDANSSVIDKWIYIFKDLKKITENDELYEEELWLDFFTKAKIQTLASEERKNYLKSIAYFNEIQDVKDAYKELMEKQLKELTQILVEEAQKKQEEAQKKQEEAQKEKEEAQKEKELSLIHISEPTRQP